MRSIPDSMDAGIVAHIDAALAGIVREQGVVIALAVESGSRAWGFPSPDSDYDCRFVFVRPLDQLLTPWPRRDVIELPLAGDLDINGWELGKALKLLTKGNAVIVEWLTSPIAYRGDEPFRDGLLALARDVAERDLVARHYLHLGRRQRRTYFGDLDAVPAKKLFYALRPAAALRWLRLNAGEAVAPMHFPTLMAQCDPPADVSAIVDDLIARKAVTRELGTGPVPRPIASFVDGELELAETAFPRVEAGRRADVRERCETFYRNAVLRLAGAAHTQR